MAIQCANLFQSVLVASILRQSLCSTVMIGDSCPSTGCTGLINANCYGGGCFCDPGFVPIDDYTCQAAPGTQANSTSPVLAASTGPPGVQGNSHSSGLTASTELSLFVLAYWVVTLYVR